MIRGEATAPDPLALLDQLDDDYLPKVSEYGAIYVLSEHYVALTAAVRAVLALHRRAHETGPTSCVECNKGRKFVAWPCLTAAAIMTALGDEQ